MTDIRYECKHVFYSPSKKMSSTDDIHFIKLNEHHPDGRVIPTTKIVKNLKIPFHTTKNTPSCRNHKQKRQFERIANVDTHWATRSVLHEAAGKALRMKSKNPLTIEASPYIYGLDTDSTVFVKDGYRNKYPGTFRDNTVAVMDLESDVVNKEELAFTGDILIGTLTMRSEQLIVINDAFLDSAYTRDHYERELRQEHAAAIARLKDKDGNPIITYTINLRVVFVTTPAEVVTTLYKRVHELQPDFLAFWNMAYDVPKMIETLERAGIRPSDIMCDPSVPLEFRRCDWNPSRRTKTMASGKSRQLADSERWPSLDCPASFYHIDAMCLYRTLRSNKREARYALDYILNKYLGFGKMKGDLEPDKEGGPWHSAMQRLHKVAYGVYALFDGIGVELLDDVNNDMKRKISIQAGASNYANFKSQPSRLVDRLYRFCRNAGLVVSVQSKYTDKDMHETFDQHLVSRNEWVVALDTWMNAPKGLRCIKGIKSIVTKLYIQVADLDATSSYPLGQFIMNIARQTTVREIVAIQGLTEVEKRSIGINMMCGPSNAVQMAELLYQVPGRKEMESRFEQFLKQKEKSVTVEW